MNISTILWACICVNGVLGFVMLRLLNKFRRDRRDISKIYEQALERNKKAQEILIEALAISAAVKSGMSFEEAKALIKTEMAVYKAMKEANNE